MGYSLRSTTLYMLWYSGVRNDHFHESLRMNAPERPVPDIEIRWCATVRTRTLWLLLLTGSVLGFLHAWLEPHALMSPLSWAMVAGWTFATPTVYILLYLREEWVEKESSSS